MNDQKIYQYLARKPDARAQDIADAMDVDLKDASDALRSLVDVGDVVRHTGEARNGLPCQLYNLSLTFKRTREGVAMLAAAKAAAPAAAPEPAPAPTPAPAAAAPAPEPSTSTTVPTRVQRAIDHLTLFKTATDEQMREAMGLGALAAPKAYLASAIKAGRVSKGANGWQLGRCDPVRKSFSISTPKGSVAQFDKHAQPVTAEEVKDLPVPVVEQLSKPAQALAKQDPDAWIEVPEVDPPAIAQAPAPAVFRCGLWSDGVLELQRNGRTVVMLDQGEHEQLGAFMRRMLGAAEQVAA